MEVLDGGNHHNLPVQDLSVHHARHQALDVNLPTPTKPCPVNDKSREEVSE